MATLLSRPIESKYKALATILPLLLVLIMRKKGGFYYRTILSNIIMGIAAFYGMIAALTFPLIGKSHLINWSVARVYYNLCGSLLDISTTIEGKENLDLAAKRGPAVYVCNHQSSLDVLIMGSVFPKATAVVAKKALKYYPFLGWYMILSNAIFLDRKNRDSAVKEARQAAQDIHRKKTSVWLFPEGTRGRSSEIDLLPFKKGAFYMAVQAGVPVVPIVFANYQNVYSSKGKKFVPGNVKIKVLPPIPTDGITEESEAIDKLANDVRDQMLVALKEISPTL
ncbi:unnamed protein product [Cunninghamella blakesleeana]